MYSTFKQAGFTAGISIILLMGILTLYCCYRVVKSRTMIRKYVCICSVLFVILLRRTFSASTLFKEILCIPDDPKTCCKVHKSVHLNPWYYLRYQTQFFTSPSTSEPFSWKYQELDLRDSASTSPSPMLSSVWITAGHRTVEPPVLHKWTVCIGTRGVARPLNLKYTAISPSAFITACPCRNVLFCSLLSPPLSIFIFYCHYCRLRASL